MAGALSVSAACGDSPVTGGGGDTRVAGDSYQPGDFDFGPCPAGELPPVVVLTPASPHPVTTGLAVTLDASGSTDDEDPVAALDFYWGLPAGYGPSDFAISGPLESPSLALSMPLPSAEGLSLSFDVTVRDTAGCWARAAVVLAYGHGPLIDLVPVSPHSVMAGDALTLDASGTLDDWDDLAALDFDWSLPAGYSAADLGISAGALATPSVALTVPAPRSTPHEQLAFGLTVTDRDGFTSPGQIVLVHNSLPAARLNGDGASLQVYSFPTSGALLFDAAASTDPDGDALSFEWAGSAIATCGGDYGVTYGGADRVTASLTYPLLFSDPLCAGSARLTLVARDAWGASAPIAADLLGPAVSVALPYELTLDRTADTSYDVCATASPTSGLSFDFTLANLDGCDTDWLVLSEDGSACATLTVPAGTPIASARACHYELSVVASDGGGASATASLAVGYANSAPICSSLQVTDLAVAGSTWVLPGDPLTVVEGHTFRIQTNDWDWDGDTYTRSWQVLSADGSSDCTAAYGLTTPAANQARIIVPPAGGACGLPAQLCLTLDDGLAASTVCSPLVFAPSLRVLAHVDVTHGKYTTVSAAVQPAATYVYTWSVAEVLAGACTPADLTLSNPTDTTITTQRRLTAPNDSAKLDCVFRVTIAADNASLGIHLTGELTAAVQARPASLTIANADASADGLTWTMTLPAGTRPTLRASSYDPDPSAVPDLNVDRMTIHWEGPAAGELSCAPTCASLDPQNGFNAQTHQYDVTFSDPLDPAEAPYRFTVRVANGVEPDVSATLLIAVSPCLWVAQGGTGDGSAPDQATDEIAGALAQADLVPGVMVCVQGGTFDEDLTLPAGNSPTLWGGFSDTGAAWAQTTVLRLNRASGLLFAAGYDGRVQGLTLRQRPAFTQPTGEAAVVTIADASPRLHRCTIEGREGAIAIGVDVHAATAATAPVISASSLTGALTGTVASAIGLRVRSSGAAVLPLVTGSSVIGVAGQAGYAAGVRIEAGADAVLGPDNSQLAASPIGVAGGQCDDCIGVDLVGAADGATASALIVANQTIRGGTFANHIATRNVGIRLAHTAGVEIRDNQQIDAWTRAGREFNAAIADGELLRDGTLTRGGSTGLVIAGNGTIQGPSWYNRDDPAYCRGPAVAAGVFLAGTQGALLEGNGDQRTFAWDQMGLQGGSVQMDWDPALDRVEPASPGLWLVDTAAVAVRSSSVMSGSKSANAACPIPPSPPHNAGLRDGLSPGGTGPWPELGSSGLALAANAITCAVPPENSGGGLGVSTWCFALELNLPDGADVHDNNIAGAQGNVIVAVMQRGGTGVDLRHNYLDADLILQGPPPPPGTVFKRALWLSRVPQGGVRAANNLIYVHRDDPYDNPGSGRLPLYEELIAPSDSALARLASNLWYIEGDDLATTGTPTYVRQQLGAALTDLPAAGLNAVPGVPSCAGNVAALPGVSEVSEPYRKLEVRLLAGSAAIDAGDPADASASDIDGQPRADGAPDIGADEW